MAFDLRHYRVYPATSFEPCALYGFKAGDFLSLVLVNARLSPRLTILPSPATRCSEDRCELPIVIRRGNRVAAVSCWGELPEDAPYPYSYQ